jgi:hypothetical protein
VGPRAARSQLLAAALAAMAVVIMAACATTVQQEIANEPPTSVEALAYFPFQVKGYQNSYARRRILVLTPADARRWIIHDGHDGKILYASETMAGAPVGPEETGASLALSSDLATLSKEIASRVIELKQHRRAKTVAGFVVAYRRATSAIRSAAMPVTAARSGSQ